MTPLIVAYIIILVVLIVLSMFFSSADMVYGSVSISRMEKRVIEKPTSKRRKRAFVLSKNYDKTISTILLFFEESYRYKIIENTIMGNNNPPKLEFNTRFLKEGMIESSILFIYTVIALVMTQLTPV